MVLGTPVDLVELLGDPSKGIEKEGLAG